MSQEKVKIQYEDKEGAEYSEVHGDPAQNLKVKTVAEKEGMTQPNLEGTTPDPHNPQPTSYEKEKAAALENALAPESPGNKQASKPPDK